MNEELCEHGTLGGRRVDIPRSKGCLEWAKLLSANAGAKIPVPRDLPRAAALYDRACSAGQVDACLNLGGLLTYEPGIPHD